MSNTDPKSGGWVARTLLLAAEMNLVRAGVLAALDTGGGSRTMISKLTLLGANMFELGGDLLYTTGSVQRTFSMRGASFDPASWVVRHGVLGYASTLVNTAQPIAVDLTHLLPHGNVLDKIDVLFAGATAGTVTPTNLPTLSIYKTHLTTGVTSQVGSTTTDTFGSAAAYETPHMITVSTAETIDRTIYHYYANFVSEAGGGATANCFLYGGLATCTITRQPRGF